MGPDYIDPGYHAPRRRPPGPQPRPVAGRRRADRPAVPARLPRGRRRRRRGRHGPVRRRAHASVEPATAPPRSWPRCLQAPVVLVVDAVVAGPQRRRARARVRHLRPAGADRRRRPEPGRHRPARGDPARGARRGRRAGARRGPPDRGPAHPVPPPRAGAGRRALGRGAAHRPRAAAPWWRPASTWTPSCGWPAPPPTCPARPGTRRPRSSPSPGRPVVAVAGGPAFTFGYAETAELLTAAGAEVVTVDPLHDGALPEGAAGAGGRRRLPRGARRRAERQRRPADGDRRPRRPRRTDRRGVRRAAVPVPGTGRRADVRRPADDDARCTRG